MVISHFVRRNDLSWLSASVGTQIPIWLGKKFLHCISGVLCSGSSMPTLCCSTQTAKQHHGFVTELSRRLAFSQTSHTTWNSLVHSSFWLTWIIQWLSGTRQDSADFWNPSELTCCPETPNELWSLRIPHWFHTARINNLFETEAHFKRHSFNLTYASGKKKN